ncbi:ribbon-helix-helix protein, CopG family [Sphingomonas sp. 10B4]|uniref:ribbon-helix-helix protein, CopG family n=1 Tax=Sphingomonas sp. 10B4 TaxID=3048575 RepID=UPI002AB3E617|nr:ribbon-helix-helix protein, CopG family [Sphingomonas sp. 10B4]MDY7525460.1 ribbon-helix-helix protein, CopG family [Sphingomonas sp. 10B4]MEB0281404.1 ribbon-helix-helix protein, CopG family [Sphingomonas sp. 10B4]
MQQPTLWQTAAMEKKDVRVQLVISPSEIEALDAWRAKQRIWSRSEAIRQLIAEGVKRDGVR